MRSEVDALAEQVHLLQAQVAALQFSALAHHCHGCSCTYAVSPAPWWQPRPYEPFRITCGEPASISGGIVTTSSALSLVNTN